MNGYVGLILRRIAVAISRSTVEGTSVYSDNATVTKGLEVTAHAVAAEYPHSSLNGTATCCSHSSTA